MLMMVQWIQAGTVILKWFMNIIVFFDPGSSCLLVTISLTEMLNLPGQPITIPLQMVNSAKQLPTKYYELYTETCSSVDERVMAFRGREDQ